MERSHGIPSAARGTQIHANAKRKQQQMTMLVIAKRFPFQCKGNSGHLVVQEQFGRMARVHPNTVWASTLGMRLLILCHTHGGNSVVNGTPKKRCASQKTAQLADCSRMVRFC